MNKIFLVVLLLFVFLGCDSSTTTDNNPDTQLPKGSILPLAVGNTWVYRLTLLNLDGSVDSTIMDTLKVTKTKVIDGDTVFILTRGVYRQVTNQGYWYGYSTMQLRAKYPTVQGEVFRRDTLPYVDPNTPQIKDTLYEDYFCKELPSKITVPAGTFTGVLYHSEGRLKIQDYRFKEVYHLVPGIGEVSIQYYGFVNGVHIPTGVRELVSYELH